VRRLLFFFLCVKCGTTSISFYLIGSIPQALLANNCKASACYTEKKRLKEGELMQHNLNMVGLVPGFSSIFILSGWQERE
jgi:hypothetical protein